MAKQTKLYVLVELHHLLIDIIKYVLVADFAVLEMILTLPMKEVAKHSN
jgi:hypothetical protein